MVRLLEASIVFRYFATGLTSWVDASLKGALVLLLLNGLRPALRYASAATRHFVWCSALFSILSLPLLSLILPAWQVSILPKFLISNLAIEETFQPIASQGHIGSDQAPPAQPSRVVETQLGQDASSHFFVQDSSPDNHVFESDRSVITSQTKWYAFALLIYVIGASWIIVRWVLAVGNVWRVRRQSRPVVDRAWTVLAQSLVKQMRLGHQVRVLKSNRVSLPITCGFLRPAVLLPEAADQWSESQRRIVLLHEFAHVRRKDCVVRAITQIICALHWFNPLIWLAARQLHLQAEHACDDIVLTLQTRASAYAGTLLKFARSQSSVESPWVVAEMIRRTQIERRLRLILDSRTTRRPLRAINMLLSTVLLAGVVLPLAAARLLASGRTFEGTGSVILNTLELGNAQMLDLREADAAVHPPEVETAKLARGQKNIAVRHSVSRQRLRAGSPATELLARPYQESPLRPASDSVSESTGRTPGPGRVGQASDLSIQTNNRRPSSQNQVTSQFKRTEYKRTEQRVFAYTQAIKSLTIYRH